MRWRDRSQDRTLQPVRSGFGTTGKAAVGSALEPDESVVDGSATFEGDVAYPGGDTDLATTITQLSTSIPQFGGCMSWELPPYDYQVVNGQPTNFGYWSHVIADALAPEVNAGADAYTAPPY